MNRKDDESLTGGIHFASEFHGIRSREILVGRGDCQDDGVRIGHIAADHVLDFSNNAIRLAIDGDFGEPRKINQGKVDDIRGADAEVDGDRGDATSLASHSLSFVCMKVWRLKLGLYSMETSEDGMDNCSVSAAT